jgi:hypothetical protein
VLPGGFWDADGRRHRDFELAALTGREEELLAQARPPETASLVTAVLSRCVRRLGPVSPVPENLARRLLVADRQYLLLKLRQATFGDQVRANLLCPWPHCGERVSIDFSIDAVPVEESPEPAPGYTMTLSEAAVGGDAGAREVSFRLPTGADQEELSSRVAHDEAGALAGMLARCVQRIGTLAPPTPERVAALSPLARAEIEARMERMAPKVEQTIEASCAECGRLFLVPFDVQRFFFGELRTDRQLLYQEVHYLAYHYHWGEGEIMTMTRDQRRTYIEVLADAIEVLNRGG